MVLEILSCFSSGAGVVFGANLVVLVRFKVGEGGVACSGKRHDFETSIYQTLVIQLFKHPPKRRKRTHKTNVKCACAFLH